MPDYATTSIGFMPLLQLRWHTGTGSFIKRYCRADQDLEIPTGSGIMYTALPAMDIEIRPQTGGIEDEPALVTVPLDTEPLASMIIEPHAEVEVVILEADFADLAPNPTSRFIGRIGKTIARRHGRTRLIQFECWGRKAFLDQLSLGIKTTDRCPLIFGDMTCQAVVGFEDVEVMSVSRRSLYFVSLPNDDIGGGNGRYTRGHVTFQGLSIGILRHRVGEARVVLMKNPPGGWLGQTVRIFEGCDKTIPDCTFYGREESFLGIGLAMPKYQPILEDGSNNP